jgi:Uma2 family endonuclease
MGIPETENFIAMNEYIQGEQLSDVRHEYISGKVYAMAGGSEAHNVLSGNLYAAIRHHFSGKPCKVFMADMKLRLQIADDDIFYYPDLLVTCDPSDSEKYYKTQPVVLVEVLSPSTERLDRREKFLSYQRLPSLQEYVLVDQEKMLVTRFRKDNEWKPEHLAQGDSLTLPSIDFELSLTDIYEDAI